LHHKVLLKMESSKEYLDQLAEIRRMMEKSNKFMSLSGFSGIFLGLYALVGSYLVWNILGKITMTESQKILFITGIATMVLVASLVTALWLSIRKAKRSDQQIWGPGSKQLLFNLMLPLATGGVFVLLLAAGRFFQLIAPSLLVFYGLALVIASRFTHHELYWAGVTQILLGLVALALPRYALFFWAVGFGGVHIVYGLYIYYAHERESRNSRR